MASPISARQPAQQMTAEESRRDFETRMLEMVSLLQSTETFFFHKVVTESMATEVEQGPFAYTLEFPVSFIKQHGRKFDNDITFLMSGSTRTWSIKLSERSFTQSRPRVLAHGPGGWKAFLRDNRIKVGDFLIFTLISFSQFEVIIGRAPGEVHPDDSEDNNENEVNTGIEEADKSSNEGSRNPSPWWNADQAPVGCTECKRAPPCPRFVVSIRPPSHPGHCSLAVPGRFWDLHGDTLKCDDLRLRGPNKAIFPVKAKRTYDVDDEKLSICLESGWEAFLVANDLRVGDILEFFLVGNSCFSVDLQERI